MCDKLLDGDMVDLVMHGWAEEKDEIDGPAILDGDVLALWRKGDAASDLIEIMGLICGEAVRVVVSRLACFGRVVGAGIHVHGRRLRHADIWLTIIDEEEVFQGVYVRRDAFVSPEVLEMVEVAAVGDES